MRVYKRFVLPIALVICVPATFAWADDTNTKKRDRGNSGQLGQLDEKTTGGTIRVSEMLGMNIQNDRGENVGEVKDIVLDADRGTVRYAAVTYGGFLGVGDKLFAVPYEAFQCKVNPDDPNERILILNVTQEQLKGVTGFDQDHWPNFADRQFTRNLDTVYGVRRGARDRDRELDVDVNRDGVDVNIKRKRDQ